MLLNRQRVKFWQKIIFGFMAVLMAGFLIFGYSGVASGCSHNSVINSGSSTIDKQVKTAVATLTKNPKSPTALLAAAQGYQSAGYAQNGLPSATQSDDLTKALSYYDRYLALPDSALGAAATGLRFDALQSMAQIYGELIDYKSAVTAYRKMLKLEPRNYLLYVSIGSNSAAAGDTAGAITAFKAFLKVDPHSQYTAQVKAQLAQLQASASPSPNTSATP
jgi:tetratricopeptide (TPR) repeat protein